MKNFGLAFLTLVFLLCGLNHVYAQSVNEAVKYHDELTGFYSELKKETWQYLKAVTRGKGARKVENKRQNIINETRKIKAQLRKVRDFNSDESFKNAAIEYVDLSYIVLKEDFDKILDMEDIAEQSYDQMEAYMLAQKKANEKLNNAFELVHQAQKDFCNKHNITLIEDDDKLSKKIKNASETLNYYSEIYLIFFKCYKQESYVLDAQNRNDVSGLEQNTNTLLSFVEESLVKLKNVDSYRADGSLKVAAQQILKFYKKEAEKEFPTLVDFYIKQDEYEKLKKILDSTGKKDRTQEVVDAYNEAVNEYNEAVQTFNRTNDSLNEQREKYLEVWNKKIEGFFDRHSK